MLDEVKEQNGDIHNLPAVLAGVSDARAAEIEKTLISRGINTISRVKHHSGLPLKVRYEKPSSLGADRLADALYAVTVYPGENVVIIDSGTAVTIDLVTAGGEFAGGTIIAGVEAQLRILHSSTATPACRQEPFTASPAP
jgi:type III pantothenate kinase